VSRGTMESVKHKLVSSTGATSEVMNTVVETPSGTLVTTIKSTGSVGTALTSTVSNILRGAVSGAAKVGGDVGTAAKGGVVGVLKGTKEVGMDATRHRERERLHPRQERRRCRGPRWQSRHEGGRGALLRERSRSASMPSLPRRRPRPAR
jgi:hypothetical protein